MTKFGVNVQMAHFLKISFLVVFTIYIVHIPEHTSNASASSSTSNVDLGRFKKARDRIDQIFNDLLKEVIKPCTKVSNNIQTLPRETTQDEQLKDLWNQIEICHNKTLDILPILKRDKMKAVVFGSTSSGKSTLINALLGDDVLPTSMGVCSSCLVQIVGCDEDESYLTLPSGNRGKVEDLEILGNELEENHLGAGDTAIVHWPKTKCELLKNDVQIIDRPGISSSSEVDQIVNDQCVDADVHIFVIDSISTITTESREYFMRVAEKLSKPNIFFVYNKWDQSVHEEAKIQKIKTQHIKVAKQLVKRGLDNEELDPKKIFFVSAREYVWAKKNDALLLTGHEERRQEFDRFTKALQTSISTHAIKTKFGSHCNEGISLCNRLNDVTHAITDSIDVAVVELDETQHSLTKEVTQLEQNQLRFGKDLKLVAEKAKRTLGRQVKKKKKDFKEQKNNILENISFEEDAEHEYKKVVSETLNEMDDVFHEELQNALTKELASIRREMEDLTDFEIPTRRTRFKFPSSQKDPSDLKDRNSPSMFTHGMAAFRRRMSSGLAKIATAGAGAGAGGAAYLYGLTAIPVVGPALFAFGSGAIGLSGLSLYLESMQEERRKEVLKPIVDRWLKDLENSAEYEFVKHVDDIDNEIRSTVRDMNDKMVKDKRKEISNIETCIQQLKVTSDKLKIYTTQMQKVKGRFEEFQQDYLQDK